jgi:hypothetical protein
LKGLPDSAVVKNSVMDLTTRSAVVSVLEDYVRNVDELLAGEASEGSEGSESSEILVH